MSKILIAPKCQYGYNTDYFHMINHLAEKNIEVEVVCFDQGFVKIEPPANATIHYIERKTFKASNYLRHLISISSRALRNRKNINWVIVSGTIEICGILPFLIKPFTPNIRWIMDVRTCSVFPNKLKRTVYDFLMGISSNFYDHTTIISDLVAERLKILEYEVLPLGAECYVNLEAKKHNGRKINFIYIGKFDDRRIEDLIRSFDAVSQLKKNEYEMKFDIIGFSDNAEVTEQLLKEIGNAHSSEKIIFHGRKSHDEIKTLFEEASIGFSYVPITDFFDVQPPTKTYEYIMNGIICIGTNTKANQLIINEKNGVLTDDNVEGLLKAMEEVLGNLTRYNSVEMAGSVSENQWKHITENFYLFLKEIEKDKSRDLKKRTLDSLE